MVLPSVPLCRGTYNWEVWTKHLPKVFSIQGVEVSSLSQACQLSPPVGGSRPLAVPCRLFHLVLSQTEVCTHPCLFYSAHLGDLILPWLKSASLSWCLVRTSCQSSRNISSAASQSSSWCFSWSSHFTCTVNSMDVFFLQNLFLLPYSSSRGMALPFIHLLKPEP